MERLTRTVFAILACSTLLLLSGCDITLGPKVEKKAIIVHPGVPVEILDSKSLPCHVLTDVDKDGETNIFQQDVGGWIAMPPEHWKTLKGEIERLRKKAGE